MRARMNRYRSRVLVLLVFLIPIAAWPARSYGQDDVPQQAGIRITLKSNFITKFKNRVTIDTTFTAVKAHPQPNAPAQDGDLHIAGTAPEVELAFVAEIMNAKFQPEALTIVKNVVGTNQPIKVSGVWRLWCEHGGTKPQNQGASVPPITTTNPDHVFEIHPITKIKNQAVVTSFKPIAGFKTKDAHDAFVAYENLRCEIIPGQGQTTIVSHMAGYNYVEFILETSEAPQNLEDGLAVMSQVLDLEGELLVRNRRMLFAAGTAPAERVKGLSAGKRLHVLGIPRIDLTLVDWRVQHANDDKWKSQNPLTWNLPYEMVIVAVYPDSGNGATAP